MDLCEFGYYPAAAQRAGRECLVDCVKDVAGIVGTGVGIQPDRAAIDDEGMDRAAQKRGLLNLNECGGMPVHADDTMSGPLTLLGSNSLSVGARLQKAGPGRGRKHAVHSSAGNVQSSVEVMLPSECPTDGQ